MGTTSSKDKEAKIDKKSKKIKAIDSPNIPLQKINSDIIVDPVNPYANCYTLSLVPKIDQTPEVKELVKKNAFLNIDKLDRKEVNDLINNHCKEFNVDTACQVILHHDKLYETSILYSHPIIYNSRDATRIFSSIIISGNIELLRRYSIHKFAAICQYTNSEKLQLLNLLISYQRYDDITKFNKSNPITSSVNDIDKLFVSMFLHKVKEQIFIDLSNLLVFVSQDSLLNIYELACKNNYYTYALAVFSKVDSNKLDGTMLYDACNKKLTRVIDHLLTKDLTRDHFKVVINNETHYVLDILVINDMYETFEKVISVFFSNSGKLLPERADGILGHCYLTATKLKKSKYIDILLKHVKFSQELLNNKHYYLSQSYEFVEQPSNISQCIEEPSKIYSQIEEPSKIYSKVE
jgi:hypothetical protein